MIIPSAAATVFLKSKTEAGTLASKSSLYTGTLFQSATPCSQLRAWVKYFDQSAISNCTPRRANSGSFAAVANALRSLLFHDSLRREPLIPTRRKTGVMML